MNEPQQPDYYQRDPLIEGRNHSLGKSILAGLAAIAVIGAIKYGPRISEWARDSYYDRQITKVEREIWSTEHDRSQRTELRWKIADLMSRKGLETLDDLFRIENIIDPIRISDDEPDLTKDPRYDVIKDRIALQAYGLIIDKIRQSHTDTSYFSDTMLQMYIETAREYGRRAGIKNLERELRQIEINGLIKIIEGYLNEIREDKDIVDTRVNLAYYTYKDLQKLGVAYDFQKALKDLESDLHKQGRTSFNAEEQMKRLKEVEYSRKSASNRVENKFRIRYDAPIEDPKVSHRELILPF